MMTSRQLSTNEVRMHLNEQSAQIEILRGTLEDLIKKRENRSHFNQFAASYGEAEWWKKLGFFLIYSGTTTGAIYASGLPLLWILPLIALYLVAIYFLSNHYQSHQTINTQTLQVLESILTESIDSIEQLRKQLGMMAEACSNLYQAEEKGQQALQEQIKALSCSNEIYKKSIDMLEAWVLQRHESEQMSVQKGQVLLKLLEETHAMLAEEEKEISETFSPELHSTMYLLTASEAHMRSLERHFQENIIQINTFVDELDQVLTQLEARGEIEREKRVVISDKTKGIMERADDALERAMHFAGRATKELGDERSSASNLAFFRHENGGGRSTPLTSPERFAL